MTDTVIGALIGAGGAILGIVITLVVTFFLEKWKLQKEKYNITLELKIETYADAIRYISLLVRLRDSVGAEKTRLDQEEFDLYNKFHPIFTIIASQQMIMKYNELRNRIEAENLKAEIAYQEVVKLLDYNVCDKKN